MTPIEVNSIFDTRYLMGLEQRMIFDHQWFLICLHSTLLLALVSHSELAELTLEPSTNLQEDLLLLLLLVLHPITINQMRFRVDTAHTATLFFSIVMRILISISRETELVQRYIISIFHIHP